MQIASAYNYTCTGLLTLAQGANMEPDINMTRWKWDCLK